MTILVAGERCYGLPMQSTCDKVVRHSFKLRIIAGHMHHLVAIQPASDFRFYSLNLSTEEAQAC